MIRSEQKSLQLITMDHSHKYVVWLKNISRILNVLLDYQIDSYSIGIIAMKRFSENLLIIYTANFTVIIQVHICFI